MKSWARIAIVFSTCAAVALALLALAGDLMDNGAVDPNLGWKDTTIFEYTVSYALDPEEDPPDVLVIGYLDDEEEWREMMGVAEIGDIVVDYWYQTTLPAAGDWAFRFQVVGGELSKMYIGPKVVE